MLDAERLQATVKYYNFRCANSRATIDQADNKGPRSEQRESSMSENITRASALSSKEFGDNEDDDGAHQATSQQHIDKGIANCGE